MGTYYTTGASRADVIRELTAGWTNAETGVVVKVLEKAAILNTLWTVEEMTAPGKPPERAIGCYLLSKHGGDWGYKPMSEGVGPYYYDCPLRFLDAVPVANEEWRHKVLAHHAELAIERVKLAHVQLYETWSIVNARNLDSVVIVNLKPLLGHARNGKRYRLQAKHLGERLQAGPAHAEQTPRVQDTVAQLAFC